MIEQKIIDVNLSESVLRKEKYLAFWLKNFEKGNHCFIDSYNKKLFNLNNDNQAEENIDFIITSESEKNKNLTVGFIDNDDFMKIIYYRGSNGVQEIYHNSKTDPVCIMLKKVNGKSDWLVWLEPLGYKRFLILNSSLPAFVDEHVFLSKPPNRYYFRVSERYNENDSIYMAILFFRSKWFDIGLYEGGVDYVKANIKNDLLIIKNISSKSNWRVFSSKLSVSNICDSSFKLNTDSSLTNKSKKIKILLENEKFYPEKNCNAINKVGNTYIYLSFREKD